MKNFKTLIHLLNIKDLKTLRNEVIIGSVFSSDYRNSENIKEEAVMKFFDGFIDFCEELLEEPEEVEHYKVEDIDDLLYNEGVLYRFSLLFSLSKEELEDELENIKDLKVKEEVYISNYLDDVAELEAAECYDDLIDEEYPDGVEIMGLTFSASYIVKQLDPTAYRCGLSDYADILRDGHLYDDEVIEHQENIEELEAYEKELEELLEDLFED